jgi:nucleotide-binding universal stress UspA family protein
MKLYPTILIATDFSPTSSDAFEEAVRLARELGSELKILHVYELPAPLALPYATASLYEGLDREARASAEHRLARMIEKARERGVAATPLLRQGYPDGEIVDAAERERADLLVLGTHGRRGASRLLVGSIAARVVANAPCPVLTIRPRAEEVAARRAC